MRTKEAQKSNQSIKDFMLGALARRRDRNAAKSGEFKPYLARSRNGLVVQNKAVPPGGCQHFSYIYRESDDGKFTKVKVWENHDNCRHAATLGGVGTSLPGTAAHETNPFRKAHKTGVSSFQTHRVIVEDAQRVPCTRLVTGRGKQMDHLCAKSSAPGSDRCTRHGGVPMKPRARTGKRSPLLPEQMPVLAGDK